MKDIRIETLSRALQLEGTLADEWILGLPDLRVFVKSSANRQQNFDKALAALLYGPSTVQLPAEALHSKILEFTPWRHRAW